MRRLVHPLRRPGRRLGCPDLQRDGAPRAEGDLFGIHINLAATIPSDVAAILAGGGPAPAGLSEKNARRSTRSTRSAIPTATAGCCRSHSAIAWMRGRGRHKSSPPRLSSRARSDVRRPRTARTMRGWPTWYAVYHRPGAGRQAAAVMSSDYNVIVIGGRSSSDRA